MTDEEIFDLAERHGWMDDFGRWNFKDDGLIGFALALLKAEREACAKLIVRECARIGELKEQGHSDYSPDISVGWYMRQHFGVEE